MVKRKNKLRVMLDSNVIISGITYPRHCFEILNHAFNQDFNLFLSEIILDEVKRNIEEKFPPYLPNLKDFLLNCPYEVVRDPKKAEVDKNKNLIRDKSDIPVILAAIWARVDFFITGDKDFIDESGQIKRKIKNNLTFLAPTNFLKEALGWKDEELDKIRLRRWSELKE